MTQVNNAVPLNQVSAAGTYGGDGSATRGIPHGLGVIPLIVIIKDYANNIGFLIGEGSANLLVWHSSGIVVSISVGLGPDATNFYVGNSPSTNQGANLAATTYRWVAFSP